MAVDKLKLFHQLGHKPHERQWLFHQSPARFRVAVCGRRFGKSTMAARDAEPLLFTPGTRGWIVGPTYDLGEKEFRVLWDDLIIKRALGKDKRIKKAYNVKQGNMYIEFNWGASQPVSRVDVRSSDHPETLVGERLDWVILSEAAKQRRETWEKYVQPALADRLGWASFVTTPEGQNWVYELWRQGQNPDHKDWDSWQFPSWYNTHVFPGGYDDPEIQRIKREVTKEWFEQEIGALFTAFVGRIYPEWSEQSHVTTVGYNPDWPNYIALDWGYANPLAAIEFQVTPDDQIRIWREHYAAFHTLEDHIKIMNAREQPKYYKINLCFGDAADPEAAVFMSRHFAPTIALPEAKENWRQGIDCVKKFLRMRHGAPIDEYGTPGSKPGLVVDHKCINTIKEFNNYRAAPAPRTGTDPQDKPLKADDHAMDALRYALVHLYELGANRHLSEISVPNPALQQSGFWVPEDMAESIAGGKDTFFSFAGTDWTEGF